MTNRLPRMRTIPKAYEEVKAADPKPLSQLER